MKIQEILEAYDPYDLHDLQNPTAEEITAAKKAKDIAAMMSSKAQRESVKTLEKLADILSVSLGKGWKQRSDEWVNSKISELTHSQ